MNWRGFIRNDRYSTKESYELIVSHSEEIIGFVEQINTGGDIDAIEVPAVLKVFIDPDDS